MPLDNKEEQKIYVIHPDLRESLKRYVDNKIPTGGFCEQFLKMIYFKQWDEQIYLINEIYFISANIFTTSYQLIAGVLKKKSLLG